MRGEAGLEEPLERAAAEERGQADEAGDGRAGSEQHQRHRHGLRRLVRTVPSAFAVPGVTRVPVVPGCGVTSVLVPPGPRVRAAYLGA